MKFNSKIGILSDIKMRLIALDTCADVGEWSANHIVKRINDFQPGPDR